jgi:hypothetical protein
MIDAPTNTEITDTDTIETRLLRCTECDSFHPAKLTNDGNLIPDSGAPEKRCSTCSGNEFVQVTLDSMEFE